MTHIIICRYQIATGGGDDTIRIWDMRSLKSLYTIPGHTNNISDLRFFRADELHFKPPTPPPESTSPDVNMDGPADKDTNATTTNAGVNLNKPYTEEEWRYRSGLFFASSGFDGVVKLWSADDWQLLRTLQTDGGKVMSVDIASDGKMIASGTFNRNFQLFAPEDML
jgi:U4/U6 small nuclear ribonucleoprotein PRP4